MSRKKKLTKAITPRVKSIGTTLSGTLYVFHINTRIDKSNDIQQLPVTTTLIA